MSDEQIDVIVKKLYEVDPQLASAFARSDDKSAWLTQNESVLEGYDSYTDKYKNLSDFQGSKPKVLYDLYKSLDGKMPSDARIFSVRKKHPEISPEEIRDWFEKTNAYRAEEERAIDEAGGRTRRALEIKNDWSLLQNLMASEYEKQRYINDPKSAIFGKDAPGFAGSSAGAKTDLIAGVGGAVADALPGVWGVPGGPILRAGRDVAHKVFGDKEVTGEKDWSDIGSDALKDLALNLGAYAVPNARKFERMTRGTASDAVNRALQIREIERGVEAGVDKWNKAKMDNVVDAIKAIMTMPESPMKNELLEASKGYLEAPDKLKDLNKIVGKYGENVALGDLIAEDPINSVKAIKERPEPHRLKHFEVTDYLEKKAVQEPLKGFDKVSYALRNLADQINVKYPGQVATEELSTATGRGSKPSVDDAIKARNAQLIDELINKYSRQWDAGFEPTKIEGDPLYEAYAVWKHRKQASGGR